jgi:hypothetical protein
VCQRLEKATGRSFVCGNSGANQYGTDNMAERIRYKDVDDETALVVTLISGDTLRGLRDADGSFFFTAPPPGPLKAHCHRQRQLTAHFDPVSSRY